MEKIGFRDRKADFMFVYHFLPGISERVAAGEFVLDEMKANRKRDKTTVMRFKSQDTGEMIGFLVNSPIVDLLYRDDGHTQSTLPDLTGAKLRGATMYGGFHTFGTTSLVAKTIVMEAATDDGHSIIVGLSGKRQ